MRVPELPSFFTFSDVAVIDIETLGLTFNFPVVLVGVLSLSADGYEARQYMAVDYHLEAPMLCEALTDLSRFPVLVTYNGKTFDIPYVNYRAQLLRVEKSLNQVNVDMLHHARAHYRTTCQTADSNAGQERLGVRGETSGRQRSFCLSALRRGRRYVARRGDPRAQPL